MRNAFERLAVNAPELLSNGGYYEFGIFKGFLIWYAENSFRHLTDDKFTFYGFDSFAGLPSGSVDEHEWWLPGNYAASYDHVENNLKLHGANMARIQLCEGWFSNETFTNFCENRELKKVAIVNIGSDVYESCVEVLHFFGNKFEIGTILLFDEIRGVFQGEEDAHGEKRALNEYLRYHPNLEIMHLLDYGRFGSVFEVTQI